MTPASWASIIAILISAVASFITYRANRALDAREAKVERLEAELTRLRLEVAAQYVRPELDQLREQVKTLSTEFHALAGAVNRLIGRLDGHKA